MKRSDAVAASGLLGPATFIVSLLLVAPLVLLGRYSLNRYDLTELMIEAVTGANYARFFGERFYYEVMRTTIGVASLVTALCLLLGLPLAYRLARSTSRWKSFFLLMIVLPLFIGSTVRSVGWMILFAKNGVLDGIASLFGSHVDLMFTPVAVIVGTLSVNLPFMVLTLQSVFEGIDHRLEEAAGGLGATPGRAFFRIVFPLALPGIAIAAILCFILGMNAYATPVLLGGPRFQMMAPLLFWEFNTNSNWPFSAALAFILMGTTLALTVVAQTAIPRRYRG